MPTRLTARALLFDMDGTLVDSTPVVERIWTHFAGTRGLDAAEVIAACHGVRMIETIRRFAPDADADAIVAELTAMEIADIDGVGEIPGARAFLAALPPERVAIVTSAVSELVMVRLAAAGIPAPAVLVDADQVERGKPDPAPFRRAADLLAVPAADTVVFEDAEAGIRAGLAAGATVVVVGAHRSATTAGLARIPDYRGVRAEPDGDAIVVSWP
jgi:sugar-phosphatase